jgi:hypothetical protein
MKKLVQCVSWSGGAMLAGLLIAACSSVDEKPAAPAPKPAAVAPTPKPPAAAAAPAPAPAKADAAKTEAVKATKTKAVEVEGVISAVGQRTITFQMERKGKVREEVVGVDEKTKIEKGGANVKLSDLAATDKGMINYEPDAYTPAAGIKITGKGEIRKVGGDD